MNIYDHPVDLERLPAAPLVVDAGACRGMFIDGIRQQRPEARIVAIEPHPEHVGKLRGRDDELLTVIEAALVGEGGPTEVVFCPHANYPKWGRVLLRGQNPPCWWEEERDVLVPTVTLADIVGQYGHIDLLKMDIEGAEKPVLETLSPSVATQISQICLEAHNWAISAEDAADLLKNLGFITTIDGFEIGAVR